MEPLLILGTVVSTGYVFGRLARALHFPKVMGYILAGIVLNPTAFGVVPADFVDKTDVMLNIVLCIITFSVGGALNLQELRARGRSILTITVLEAELAFLFVVVGVYLIFPSLPGPTHTLAPGLLLPLGLLLGSLASPTDPSTTLAVAHEFKAKGPVSSTIFGVAALDDALGIINFGFAMSLAGVLLTSNGATFSLTHALSEPLRSMAISVVAGIVFGTVFNLVSPAETSQRHDGEVVVLCVGLLTACFGVTDILHGDALLATMVVGLVVTNFNKAAPIVFGILERNVEDIVFVLFFTFSGMHLNLVALRSCIFLIPVFVLLRAAGKWAGCALGGVSTGMPATVWRYVPGGLMPQGGIVVGLALLMRQDPAFAPLANLVINLIIGATVVHEVIGPAMATRALRNAGELEPEPSPPGGA